MKYSEAHKGQALEYLSKILSPGSTVYSVAVIADGSRQIILCPYIDSRGQTVIRNITMSVATLLDCKVTKTGAIVVRDAGLSRGLRVVRDLDRALGLPADVGYGLRHESL